MMKKIAGITLLVVGLAGIVLCVIATGDTSGPGGATNWETTSNVPVATTDQRFVLVGVAGMISLILGTVTIMHLLMTENELDSEREKIETPETPLQSPMEKMHDVINPVPSYQKEIFRPDPQRNEDRGISGIHRLLEIPHRKTKEIVQNLHNLWISKEQRDPREISGIPVQGVRNKDYNTRALQKHTDESLCN